MLDLTSIHLFLLVAEFGNLTRAAEAAGTVQPAVSQRLKGLEARLGRRLLERTSRRVRLTAAGEAFLPHARALMAAHDQAMAGEAAAPRLSLALSEHAVGQRLEGLLHRLGAALPSGTALSVRTGLSLPMRALFDAGLVDAVVIRREGGGAEGELLRRDPLGWRAPVALRLAPGQPLPLATLGAPCGVREAAIRALDAAAIPWVESFVAGGCASLLAGISGGLGVAPMGLAASGEMPDQGPAMGLPALPPSEIVLFARAGTPPLAAGIRALAAGLR